MFLFVFVGAKRRSGEISMYQFLISANREAATFSIQKVPESAGDNGAFPYSFCCAVFELKQNLAPQPYPEMNS